MSALGTYLSHLREERGLSIEELARVTRVAPRYLEALERDDFTELPAPVFTKGYIRAYCQALDVPGDEALARYSETAPVAVETSPALAGAGTQAVGDAKRRSSGTLLVSFVLFVGFGVALFVVALLLRSGRPEVGAGRVEPPDTRAEASSVPVTRSAPEEPAEPAPVPVTKSPPPVASAPVPVSSGPTAGASALKEVASGSTPATGPTPQPAVSVIRPPDSKSGAAPTDARAATDPLQSAGPAPELPSLRLGGVASPYRLVARTQEATWLRVRTEDGRATEETVPAGEVREWISNRPFVVTIGNAAGVALELNGHKLPALGGRGVPIFRLILPPPEP
jgi:cytoskeleton protein RodZ